jgi:hypothetical protein
MHRFRRGMDPAPAVRRSSTPCADDAVHPADIFQHESVEDSRSRPMGNLVLLSRLSGRLGPMRQFAYGSRCPTGADQPRLFP